MFKKPFSFKGRIRRTEFIISYVITLIINALLIGVIESTEGLLVLIPIIAAYIIALWFFIAQCVKRAHDIDDSAWWLLFPLYIIWLIFIKGVKLSNEYGNNPRIDISN